MVDLKQTRELSKQILVNFVDAIGSDGKAFVSLNNCPMTWGKPKMGGVGEFVTPYSKRMQSILAKSKMDDKTKEVVNSKGLIIIDLKYREMDTNPDLFVSIIHETIHSNRDLLIFDATREESNEKAYTYEGDKIVQSTSNYSFVHADASQDILKGSIDDSRKTVSAYDGMSTDKLEDLEFESGKRDTQMGNQQTADEALVELMSILAVKLYSNSIKGKTTDIWELISETRDHFEGEDISVMCDIILKHGDLELFYWMIDPIGYSMGDVHYDFFKWYTQNDKELLDQLYDSGSLDLDDYLGFGDSKRK